MARQYPTSEKEFMAKVYQGGRSLHITIPCLIVRHLGIRPGSTVKVTIKEVFDLEEKKEDPLDPEE